MSSLPHAVRTPSKEQASGYSHAVVFSRTELSMTQVVERYDGRASMEADLKGDKHGLGLATISKHRLSAQKMVVLLMRARPPSPAVGASVVERVGSPST